MIMQFGLFGICDGHGGAAAAISASKLVLHFPFWRFYFGHNKFFTDLITLHKYIQPY